MKLAMTCPPVYERYPVMGASRRGQTIWPYQSPRAFPRKRGNGEQGECINSIRAKAVANLARSRLLNPIGGKADIGATLRNCWRLFSDQSGVCQFCIPS